MDKQGTYGVWLRIMSWSAFVLNQRIQRFYWIFDGRSISHQETEKTFVESKLSIYQSHSRVENLFETLWSFRRRWVGAVWCLQRRTACLL